MLSQCEKDDWKSIHKGLWSSTMSPYELKFVDVKFVGRDSGSVTVTLDEVSQGWRYVLLAVGISLLFLAPVVSTWIPFYCTSSMAIGVFVVILIILYQVTRNIDQHFHSTPFESNIPKCLVQIRFLKCKNHRW